MKAIALLTGRGNNTLKDKNMLDILGKPVLYYPAIAGKKSFEIIGWYCSSDDNKILDYAETIGYKPIVRPDEFAQSNSQHEDCILHALEYMKQDIQPDILVVILANNITIKSEWISECVRMMEADMSISAVVPVYNDNDHHPLRAKSVNGDGNLEMYEKTYDKKISSNRQDLPTCYFLAHNFWVLNIKNLLSDEEGQQPWGFMGNKIVPYEIAESIDIHQKIDLIIAENWIKKNFTD